MAITGVGTWVLKTFFTGIDLFGPTQHPWLTYFKGAHLIFAPILLMAFGMIFEKHILKYLHLKNSKKRASGLSSLVTITLLVLSGQSLLVISEQNLLEWIGVIHLVAGILFLSAFLVHFKFKK